MAPTRTWTALLRQFFSKSCLLTERATAETALEAAKESAKGVEGDQAVAGLAFTSMGKKYHIELAMSLDPAMGAYDADQFSALGLFLIWQVLSLDPQQASLAELVHKAYQAKHDKVQFEVDRVMKANGFHLSRKG